MQIVYLETPHIVFDRQPCAFLFNVVEYENCSQLNYLEKLLIFLSFSLAVNDDRNVRQ